MSKKLDMKLSISYPSGHRGDCVNIRVCDETSSMEFLDLTISHEEFSRALGALQRRPCTGEVRGLERLGKQLEVKQESIAMPDGVCKSRREKCVAWLTEAVKQFEVEGWKAEVDGAMRTQQPPGAMVVTFRRYI